VDVLVRTDGPSFRVSMFAKNQSMAQWQQKNRVPAGRRGIFVGQVSKFRDEWQLTHPQVVLFGTADEDAAQLSLDAIGELYPIYPLTKGVDSWDLQRAVAFALSMVEDVPDVIPPGVRVRHELLDVRTALQRIHNPDDWGQVTSAQRRFRFEEALVTQLVLARRRRAIRELGGRARTGADGGLLAAFDARLPFELTTGQREIGAQIEADLAQPHPMNRLLQGEVGSGKTLVALRAMLRRSTPVLQAALLAPPRCSPSSTTARSRRCSATSRPAACSAARPRPPTSSCSRAR